MTSVTIELTQLEAKYLYDEVVLARKPHALGLTRYEKGISRMAEHVIEQLTAHGIRGVLADGRVSS